MLTILAVITIETLVNALIWLGVGAAVCWLFWWFIDFVKSPEPFNKAGKVIVAIFAVVVVLNVLLSFVGQEFIELR